MKAMQILLTAAWFGIATCAVAATNTWTGAVDGEWAVPGNWSLGRVPAGGDILAFPADAPNKTQNAMSVGSSSSMITLILEGGGYLITNTAAEVWFQGPTIGNLLSTGDNRVDFSIRDQASMKFISNDGTLTLGRQIDNPKGLWFEGNGNVTFLNWIKVGDYARTMSVYSTGTVRVQRLGRLRASSGTSAYGVRVASAGTLLVNGEQDIVQGLGTGVYGIGADGTLGGIGHAKVTTNVAYLVSGVIGIGYQPNSWTPAGNGTLSPGDPLVNGGVGTFTVTVQDRIIFGSDEPPATGTLRMDVGAAGATDMLVVNGALDLSSTNDVLQLVAPENAVLTQSATLMTFTGARTGAFSKVRVNGTDVTLRAEQSFNIGAGTARIEYVGMSNGSLLLVPTQPRGTVIAIR